jgi:hypothetical protein
VVTDGHITPAGDSAQLEIELDTGAAVISGNVAGSRGYVLAAKLPLPAAQFVPEGSASFRTAAIDAQGKFRLAGLAPGEYRVIALPSGPIDASRIQLLATRGERITVARGDTRTLDLKVTQ